MRWFQFTAAMLFGITLPVYPQAGDSAGQADQIQSLLSRIDRLERRMADLEKELAAASPSARPSQDVRPAAHSAHPDVSAADPGGEINYPSLKIAGFSDINFAATDQRGTRSGFNEGQFILHLNSNLAPKVTFLGELSLSARSDAGTGTPAATGFNAEVERAIIRFEQNDYLKASFGRYHTPINYWNTEFHHGQWLQTTVSRPEMVQFGGRFIPVHFVGALIEGAAPAGGLNLNYNLGLGNGRGSVISRGGDFGDNNNNRAWLAGLFAKPDHPFGLRFGGAIYRDKISPPGAAEGREWIQSGHIVWQKENPEIIAEFTNIKHELIGASRAIDSQAWYVQTAYRLPDPLRLWKPYYRFEYIHIPKSDPIFAGIPSLAGSVVGVRYDISSFAALKFEYRNQRRPGQPRVNGGFFQTSFTF